MKRTLVLAGLLLAAPAASQTPTLPDPLFRYSAIELTHYGAVPGQNANVALQAALNDCAAKGRPVHVPAGSYIITATSNWVTSNNNCPGIYGDGPNSIFVPFNFNGAVITANVQAGIPQTGKTIKDLAVAAQWSPAPVYDQTRLINITGASDGWAYSNFLHLRGYAVHDIVRFATATVSVGGFLQSNSGWNLFDGLFGQGGSQGIVPDSFVNYADSSSTGNEYVNLIGANVSGAVNVGGGVNVMVGDMVFNGGHIGQGRVLYIGGGATCPGYLRSININNVQVDANATEVVKAECGVINNIKMSGTFGGATPWAGINYLDLSEVHDLGESHWGEGGPVQIAGTGSHTIALWTVTLQTGAVGGTFTRIELAITGTLGGVGSGGSQAIYHCASRSSGAASCKLMSSDAINADIGTSTPAAGWPALSFSVSGNVVTFSAAFTDSVASTFRSNIVAKHGSLKVQRVFPAAGNGFNGVTY